jgi:hypothetical protein
MNATNRAMSARMMRPTLTARGDLREPNHGAMSARAKSPRRRYAAAPQGAQARVRQ